MLLSDTIVDFHLSMMGLLIYKYEPFWQEVSVKSLILRWPLRPVGLLFVLQNQVLLVLSFFPMSSTSHFFMLPWWLISQKKSHLLRISSLGSITRTCSQWKKNWKNLCASSLIENYMSRYILIHWNMSMFFFVALHR